MVHDQGLAITGFRPRMHSSTQAFPVQPAILATPASLILFPFTISSVIPVSFVISAAI